MSKMKELDNIADVVVDILEEHLEHNIEWAISDWPLDGDDFNDAIHQIKQNVIHKLNTKYNG